MPLSIDPNNIRNFARGLDEIIVVLVRMTALNQYLAIDIATCEVLAEIDLGDE